MFPTACTIVHTRPWGVHRLDGFACALCCRYTVTLQARDAAQNRDRNPAHVNVTVDTVPPATVITSHPPSFTNTSTIIDKVQANERVRGFSAVMLSNDEVVMEAWLGVDTGGNGTTATWTVDGLADASYHVVLWGMDTAGNTDASRNATVGFTVDLTPPAAVVMGRPDVQSNDTAPFVSLACPEEPGQCGFRLTPAPDPAPAGTVGATWLTGHPAAAGSPVSLSVVIDASTSTEVTHLQFATLPADGSYAIAVEVTDAAGNQAEDLVVVAWLLDTVPPVTATALVVAPALPLGLPPVVATSSGTSVQLACGVSEASNPCSFTVVVDGDAAVDTPVPATVELPSLTAGHHVVRAVAVDDAGNTEVAPVDVDLAVDVEQPVTALVAKPNTCVACSLLRSALLSYSLWCAVRCRCT